MSKTGKIFKRIIYRIKKYFDEHTWDDEVVKILKDVGLEKWDEVKKLIKSNPEMSRSDKIKAWTDLVLGVAEKIGKTDPRFAAGAKIGRLVMGLVYPYVIAKKSGKLMSNKSASVEC